MLQHVHAGRDVERWVGFAAAVVRSVVRLQKPFMLDSLFTVIAQLSVAAQSKR